MIAKRFYYLAIFIVSTALYTNVIVHASSPEVLTSENFDQVTSQHVWLVKFYAPWCGHCKKLAPVFDQLATEQKNSGTSDFRIGKVDCTIEKTICERFSVASYPTIKVIKDGYSYDYASRRDFQSLLDYVKDGYRSAEYKEKVLSLDEYRIQKANSKAAQEALERDSAVVTITTSTFDSVVKNSPDPWILKFYAPWCGHCKRLAPTWHKLSKEVLDLQSKTNVGKVDCTAHRRVCSRFGVRGYPAIFYVNKGTVYKYEGTRSLQGFLDYIESGWEKAENLGPVKDETFISKIVDVSVEWAQNHTTLAVVVVIGIFGLIMGLVIVGLDYCLDEGDEEMDDVPPTTKASPAPIVAADKPKAE